MSFMHWSWNVLVSKSETHWFAKENLLQVLYQKPEPSLKQVLLGQPAYLQTKLFRPSCSSSSISSKRALDLEGERYHCFCQNLWKFFLAWSSFFNGSSNVNHFPCLLTASDGFHTALWPPAHWFLGIAVYDAKMENQIALGTSSRKLDCESQQS